MHIAVNGWFARELTTGHGQYLHQMLKTLPAASGLNATRITRTSLLLPFPRSAGQLSQMQADWPAVALMRVNIPRFPEKVGKLWWEQFAVPLAAKKLEADLLWVPYWAAPLWQPCPVVVTVHDVIHRLLPAYRGGRLQRLYTALVSLTARRAAAAITVSHAAARDIAQELALPADQLHVVYNGIEQRSTRSPNNSPDIDADRQQAVRQKYQLPNRFFLYLGGFDVRKNVRTTLHAYARYLEKGGDPAIRLVIGGRLPERDSAFAPDPQKIAAELNLQSQVQFCGYVDEADKRPLYHLATAYIFPSLYEGFGLMALEAMQAGTPVVTSNR